jgi:hypothetical protein
MYPDYGGLMNTKGSLANPCETAAVRIQYWFGKDKTNLLYMDKSLRHSQEFCKKYKCDLLKPPLRILSQFKPLPLEDYIPSKKKRQNKSRSVITKGSGAPSLRFTLDSSHCSVNQKNWNHVASTNTLSSERVDSYCRLKEHLLVFRRLKSMSKQPTHASARRHQIDAIKSSSEQDLARHPYIQEWQKFKEERHFQLDRIIKFLAD